MIAMVADAPLDTRASHDTDIVTMSHAYPPLVLSGDALQCCRCGRLSGRRMCCKQKLGDEKWFNKYESYFSVGWYTV